GAAINKIHHSSWRRKRNFKWARKAKPNKLRRAAIVSSYEQIILCRGLRIFHSALATDQGPVQVVSTSSSVQFVTTITRRRFWALLLFAAIDLLLRAALRYSPLSRLFERSERVM